MLSTIPSILYVFFENILRKVDKTLIFTNIGLSIFILTASFITFFMASLSSTDLRIDGVDYIISGEFSFHGIYKWQVNLSGYSGAASRHRSQ